MPSARSRGDFPPPDLQAGGMGLAGWHSGGFYYWRSGIFSTFSYMYVLFQSGSSEEFVLTPSFIIVIFSSAWWHAPSFSSRRTVRRMKRSVVFVFPPTSLSHLTLCLFDWVRRDGHRTSSEVRSSCSPNSSFIPRCGWRGGFGIH